MIRINFKVVLFLLCTAVVIVTLSWTRCGEVVLSSKRHKSSGQAAEWVTGNKKVPKGQVIR
jgi:hypothetical protein